MKLELMSAPPLPGTSSRRCLGDTMLTMHECFKSPIGRCEEITASMGGGSNGELVYRKVRRTALTNLINTQQEQLDISQGTESQLFAIKEYGNLLGQGAYGAVYSVPGTEGYMVVVKIMRLDDIRHTTNDLRELCYLNPHVCDEG